MIVNELTFNNWRKDADYDELLAIYLENLNIRKINLRMIDLKSLVFLSVRNNNLKYVEFINLMPNLWYFDIRNNNIDDLEPINKKKTFGFLGLTIGQFATNSFFELRMLNLGILKIEGILYEDCLKSMSSNYSNVLQINESVIFYSMYITNFDYLEKKNLSRRKSFLRGSKPFSPKRSEIGFKSMKSSISADLSTYMDGMQRCAELVDFFDLNNTRLKSTFIDNTTFDYSNPEYINIERRKLIFLTNIYEKIMVINKDPDLVIAEGDCSKYSFIDLNVLNVVNYPSIQIKVLTIFHLFILGIFGKKLSITSILHIYGLNNIPNKVSYNLLNSLFNLDLYYLIGLYYKIYDELLDNSDITTINELNIQKDEVIKHLQANCLVLNCNLLIENKDLFKKNIKDKDNVANRKHEIKNTLINFYIKKLNNLNSILYLIQNIQDYFVIINFDKALILNEKSNSDYKLFLEIRACIFDHLNKENPDPLLKFAYISGKQLDNMLFDKISSSFYYLKRDSIKNKYTILNRFKNSKSVFPLVDSDDKTRFKGEKIDHVDFYSEELLLTERIENANRKSNFGSIEKNKKQEEQKSIGKGNTIYNNTLAGFNINVMSGSIKGVEKITNSLLRKTIKTNTPNNKIIVNNNLLDIREHRQLGKKQNSNLMNTFSEDKGSNNNFYRKTKKKYFSFSHTQNSLVFNKKESQNENSKDLNTFKNLYTDISKDISKESIGGDSVDKNYKLMPKNLLSFNKKNNKGNTILIKQNLFNTFDEEEEALKNNKLKEISTKLGEQIQINFTKSNLKTFSNKTVKNTKENLVIKNVLKGKQNLLGTLKAKNKTTNSSMKCKLNDKEIKEKEKDNELLDNEVNTYFYGGYSMKNTYRQLSNLNTQNNSKEKDTQKAKDSSHQGVTTEKSNN